MIDQVAEQLHKVRMSAKREHGPSHEPKLSVYMDYDFWVRCMKEIQGEVGGPAFEFFHSYSDGKQTLFGFPVYKVVEARLHPDYVIHCNN